jgi:ABC-type Fe3+ transport system substrate-binding protein
MTSSPRNPNHPQQTALKWTMGAALLLTLAVPFVLRHLQSPQAETIQNAELPVRKLVIISPHWEGIREEFEWAFSRHTAETLGHRTSLEWLDLGGTSDAVRYVRSEFQRSPDGIGVDMFFGGGVDPYLQFAEEDLLSPCDIPEEILGKIPQHFSGVEVYDEQRRWFGACLAGFGIVYNKKVLEHLGLAAPSTWEDLARPEYHTWVGSGDPRSSGSVHMAYEIILQAYGWEKGWNVIARMGVNIRNFSRSASQVPEDTALGEVACGTAIDVYAWRAVAEAGEERIGFQLPEGVTVVSPDSIGVLRGAPHRELAERFVQFVLSQAGQKLWVLKAGDTGGPGSPRKFPLGRMSVIPGFANRFGDRAAVTLNPYDWHSDFTYDNDKGSQRWTILNDLIGAAIIDTHSELMAAWKAVQDLPADSPRRRALVEPPVSEDRLMMLARQRWNDPAYRARVRGEWAREAQKRYHQVAGDERW